jgi:4-hydroxy-2-oxoheptanedioate aldolase
MRGISGGRTTGFGTIDLIHYFERANREIIVVAMIEDREGVENIDEIVSVPGIDLILEGAIDLSQSYGVPGHVQHATVQAAIERVFTACVRHDIPFCAIPRVHDQFQYWSRRGVRAFLLGDDRAVSFRALKANVSKFTDLSAIEKESNVQLAK